MTYRRAALLIGALAAVACGSSGDSKKEAGGFSPDASVPETQDTRGDVVMEAPMNLCDPAKQDCPGDEVCGPHCQSAEERFACATEMRGGGGQDAPCTASSECKKGLLCIAPKDRPQACHQYCSGDVPCPMGTVCLDIPMQIGCAGGVHKLDSKMCFKP